jgi:putative DNA primase/helicase
VPVQILGLREYFDKKSQKTKLASKFFDKNWQAESVPELFKNLDVYLNLIPKDERYNIFYTVAECAPDKERVLAYQDIIPIDIDGIDTSKLDLTIDICLKELGLNRDHTGIVFSGHGIHFLVQVSEGWDDAEYFDRWRLQYKSWIARVDIALKQAGLTGSADPTVFSGARILRLPGTENRKPARDPINCTVINPNISPITWDWESRSGLAQVTSRDQIAPQQLKKFPTPDTKAMLAGCEFIKRCRDDASKVTEPQWYALISLVANAYGNRNAEQLAKGRALCHEYSKGHAGYSEHETNTKIDQALMNAGPRTCANVNTLWEGCNKCPHFGTGLVSPITITSEEYIKTKDTGFRHMKHDANGNPTNGKVAYDDLTKFFAQKHDFIVDPQTTLCYVYNSKYWEEIFDLSIKAFAKAHVKPFEGSAIATEFLNTLLLDNHAGAEWFEYSTNGKINFQNGVLELETMELHAHSKEYGFRYVLPYEYNPSADAPRFKQFLDEVTIGDKEMQDVLMEFMGYCLSGDDCWLQKAMVLEGEGSNGKSVFLDVLRELGGSANYSSLTLYDMKNEANRYQLENKLFNVAEETPVNALQESSTFKNIVTGGEILVRRLYKQTYTIKNRAKLIFACNELPKSFDNTNALFRRLVICPFEAVFTKDNADTGIRQKLYEELPGIFNMAAQGYLRLRKRGFINETERMRNKMDKYKSSIDSVLSWMEERTTACDSKIYLKDAYMDYKFEMESDGERPHGKKVFSDRLQKILVTSIQKDRGGYFLSGIKLSTAKEDY